MNGLNEESLVTSDDDGHNSGVPRSLQSLQDDYLPVVALSFRRVSYGAGSQDSIDIVSDDRSLCDTVERMDTDRHADRVGRPFSDNPFGFIGPKIFPSDRSTKWDRVRHVV